MPAAPSPTIPLRIVVEQPLAGVALALQHGKDGLQPPTTTSPAQVVFDFDVRLGAPKADGSPNLLGPFTQGSAAERFVYIGVGQRAGQAASPWNGRIKVPLTGILASDVEALRAAPGQRLAVRFSGRSPKGGPTLATVKLAADAWALVSH